MTETRNRNYTQTSVLILASVALFTSPSGSAQSRATGGEKSSFAAEASPSRVDQMLRERMFTACPAKDGAEPDLFFYDQSGKWAAAAIFARRNFLFQYKGLWTVSYPYDLTPGDRANGLQYKALVLFGAPTVRTLESRHDHKVPSWSAWESRSSVKPPKEVIYGAMGSTPGTSAIALAITMVKKDGHWLFRVGWGEPDARHSFDPDAYAVTKKSCAAISTGNPFR